MRVEGFSVLKYRWISESAICRGGKLLRIFSRSTLLVPLKRSEVADCEPCFSLAAVTFWTCSSYCLVCSAKYLLTSEICVVLVITHQNFDGGSYIC